MKRRTFIVKTGLSAAGIITAASWPFSLSAKERKEQSVQITVLHTNDMHSRIEAFPADDPKFAGRGGMEARARLIDSIRAKEPHVLLLDSGDVFQGTAYFNFFGGEAEFKLMSAMGYDAMTLGNHDFDAGIDGLIKQLPNKNFPIVNANYDLTETNLNTHIKRYHIIEKGGKRIGIFGLGIELKGLVPDALFGKIRYEDPIVHANETALKLKELGCDLIICLSHLGWKYNDQKTSDIRLAEASRNIDLILGGHTHTFFPAPFEFRNADGLPVLVNQVGWGGLMLGRIDFVFDRIPDEKKWRSSVQWIA